MRYHGKSFDSFEYALDMLLVNNGYTLVPHADCISKRSFAFKVNERDMKNWIVPVIKPVQAIENVLRLGGLLDNAEIVRDEDGIYSAMERGCLVGPVGDKTRYESSTLYYSGNCRYIYVCGRVGEYYRIHDPAGFPMRLLKRHEIPDTYIISDSIGVSISRGGKQTQIYDSRYILTEGLKYKRLMDNWEGADVVINNFRSRFSRRWGLSLQFGLYNYLIQVGKILDFAADNKLISEEERKKEEKIMHELYICVHQYDFVRFIDLKETLLDWLGKI